MEGGIRDVRIRNDRRSSIRFHADGNVCGSRERRRSFREDEEMKQYRVRCRYCGEVFIAGSATGGVCDKPECQEKYDRDRRERKKELERQRPRNRKLYKKPPHKPSPGSIREDVMRAEELGLSYGQYKALQN